MLHNPLRRLGAVLRCGLHSSFCLSFPMPCMCRFEAGTPAIAEAIGLGAACDYLRSLGMENVAAHEKQLGTYLYEQVHNAGSCTKIQQQAANFATSMAHCNLHFSLCPHGLLNARY